MKGSLVRGLSIGFQTIKSTWEDVSGRMVRHISELKLFEVSVVTFAMNPGAKVIAVKSQEAIDERFKALESKISALSAELSTAKAAGTGEPAAPEPPTPVIDHSAALSVIERLRAQMSA
jgi:type II secretory pathway component PulM